MANFPSISPTYNTKKQVSATKKIIRFADGYEQRITFGVPEHQSPRVYNLTFNVTTADANTIMAFLDARDLDNASFTFTPPNGTQGQYVCEKYDEDIVLTNRSTVRATFRQVFEPS
tara:strand:- start:21 stop:368 length:348 start_codon:yes stop_codon:yes gene_type:complete